MAYTAGTCTGHLALLDALETFLEAQGWTTKRYTTGDVYEYVAMGPGLTGTDEIYIGIRAITNTSVPYYNWNLRGYTGYSSSLDFLTQPGSILQSGANIPSLLLTNGSIQYWFVANTRRVIIIAKCGLSYECAYLGLILPYAPELQISYPLFIGGSHVSGAVAYTTQDYDHFSFWNPQTSTTSLIPQSVFLANNTWLKVVNRGGDGNGLVIHPYCGLPSSEGETTITMTNFFAIRENIDGSYPLFPCRVMSNEALAARGIYGELDGVYGIPVWGFMAEDTITIDSAIYVIVPSAFRTSRQSYAAIRLV